MIYYVKQLLVVVFLCCFTSSVIAQKDMIIMRDGNIHRDVKVQMTTTDSTYYLRNNDKEKRQYSAFNDMIYLIKYEKRGNVYFSLEGKQFTGDIGSRHSDDATTIYLLEGREISAYNLIISEDKITYQTGKKKKSPQVTMSKDDIFMICYPDGTRDIINDFSIVIQRREQELERERLKAEEERLVREATMFPKVGWLTTITGKQYTVTVIAEKNGIYTFTREDLDPSPLFQIKKENISELEVKYEGL